VILSYLVWLASLGALFNRLTISLGSWQSDRCLLLGWRHGKPTLRVARPAQLFPAIEVLFLAFFIFDLHSAWATRICILEGWGEANGLLLLQRNS
jgi:hypothetical protein